MARKSAYVWRVVALAGSVWASSGCLPIAPPPPNTINVAAGLQAQYVAYPAENPAAVAPSPDGRAFYTEKNTGQIRVIKDGTLLAQPFASVPVNFAGDRGLLGIALHPRFADNGRVYVFYARSDTGLSTDDPQAVVDHRIVYFTPDETGGDVSTAPETFVAALPAGETTTRVGGLIGFAADRTLLVAMGDLADPNAAQSTAFLHGKILRYNDDGTIPASNPHADSPIFALGFREPRGLTFDPQTDVAFITERSGNGIHVIDRVVGASNYGWPNIVGLPDTPDELAFVANHPEYVPPLLESHSQFVGAAFNPSAKYGHATVLDLFYGVNDLAHIVALALSPERTASAEARTFATGLPTPMTAVAFSPAGTLYVATQSAVLRIVLFQ